MAEVAVVEDAVAEEAVVEETVVKEAVVEEAVRVAPWGSRVIFRVSHIIFEKD